MQKYTSILMLSTVLFIFGCATHNTNNPTSLDNDSRSMTTSSEFFAQLQGLCGQKFSGQSVFPATPEDSFYGKKLVAEFSVCSDTVIKVPFAVGNDHSRTWIFTQTKDGLELKHDHRHHDGTPDDVTNYGGMATQTGSALSQFFAADVFTAQLIPAAATNVWNVKLSDDGETLTYYLERHSKPRFKAILSKQ